VFVGLAQAGTKALGGARFSLVNLVPATFLTGFLTLLIVSGVYGGHQVDLSSTAEMLGANAGWAVVAVFGVFVVAVLLRPFQVAVVQLLEGYWQPWPGLAYATQVAIERHRRIRHTAEVVNQGRLPGPPSGAELSDVARAQRQHRTASIRRARARAIYHRYPRPRLERRPDGRLRSYDDRLMPTLLGNTLRDGEDNAGDRYGLRMQVVAPRLYPYLSPKLDAAISQNLDLIDTAAAMCIAFAVAALASLPLVARHDAWRATPLIALILAILAYRGAIQVARGHARLLATVFDLHRFDMIAALHYELPRTPLREDRFNKALSAFLDSHDTAVVHMQAFRYVHQSPATPGGQAGTGPAGADAGGGPAD